MKAGFEGPDLYPVFQFELLVSSFAHGTPLLFVVLAAGIHHKAFERTKTKAIGTAARLIPLNTKKRLDGHFLKYFGGIQLTLALLSDYGKFFNSGPFFVYAETLLHSLITL